MLQVAFCFAGPCPMARMLLAGFAVSVMLSDSASLSR
jgi:hypothetical protein